jgi:hypothetical protein
MPFMASAFIHLHGLNRFGNNKHIHDALEVEGQHMKAHFRALAPTHPGQEVHGIDPVLARTGDMLDSTSLGRRCLKVAVYLALHGLQCESANCALGDRAIIFIVTCDLDEVACRKEYVLP